MAASASATWKGGLKDGGGTYSLGSGAAKDVPYLHADRFLDGKGSNPEELIGAAHAACFVMFFSAKLGDVKAESLSAESKVSLGKDDAGPIVTEIRVKFTAKVPGLDKAKFDELVKVTEAGCPIARLYKGNTKVIVDATLA